MVEYHGWFAINQSVDGENEDNIISIVDELNCLIEKMGSFNRILALKPMNGRYFLHLAGNTNHRGEDVEEVFDLIKFIADKTEGSYGTLYFRDDEDSNRNNEFTVYAMVRGEITEKEDYILSPCDPVIEE